MRSPKVKIHVPENPIDEVVVLIHGLIRSARSLRKLRKHLVNSGYAAVSLDYPSRSDTVAHLAEAGIPKALKAANGLGDQPTVHFVTHSMGAILLRAYLKQHPDLKIGHTVMLGPPNQGSEVVDKLKRIPGFRLINGPAGLELGTDHTSVPRQLGPVTSKVGVIAGVKSMNPLLSLLLPKPNDGKVSLASTQVEGMTDFCRVNASHTLMMDQQEVIDQTLSFLRRGEFNSIAGEKNEIKAM